MARFYRDHGIPAVEHLARACATARGRDPDEPVQETGYDETTIPLWWFYQDDARNFLAMMEAFASVPPAAGRAALPEGES